MTKEELKEKVKVVMQLDDEYDDELAIHVNSSIAKLKLEGVPIAKIDDEMSDLYVNCVAINCHINMYQDIDINPLMTRYMSLVGTLRLNYL